MSRPFFIGVRKEASDLKPTAASSDIEIATDLFQRALDLQTQGQDTEAITIFNDIDRRFGDRAEVSLSSIVANSLLQKAHLLDNEDQAPVLKAIIRRYGSHDEADIASPVSWARWTLAGCLEKQGLKDEALAMHRQVLHHHGHRTEPSFPDLLEYVRRDIDRLTGNKADEIPAP